jgi:hypothetical protein
MEYDEYEEMDEWEMMYGNDMEAANELEAMLEKTTPAKHVSQCAPMPRLAEPMSEPPLDVDVSETRESMSARQEHHDALDEEYSPLVLDSCEYVTRRPAFDARSFPCVLSSGERVFIKAKPITSEPMQKKAAPQWKLDISIKDMKSSIERVSLRLIYT